MRSLSIARWSFVLTISPFAALCLSDSGCKSNVNDSADRKSSGKTLTALDNPPAPTTEMRAVFVATAWNIDWPSERSQTPAVQIAEMHDIIKRAKEMNCNAILLEVRSFGDRIHVATTQTAQPWANALNRGAYPGYDPLAEWILACHDQGIELHAWIQAFRVDHLVRNYPVVPTEDGAHLYLDWTSKRVQDYVVDQVIADLLAFKARRPIKAERKKIITADGATTMATAQSAAATSQPDGDDLDGIIIDQCGVPRHPILPQDDAKTQATTMLAMKPPNERIQKLLEKAKEFPRGDKTDMDDFIEAAFKKVHDEGNRKFGLTPDGNASDAKKWLKDGQANYVIPQLYVKRMNSNGKNHFVTKLQGWLNNIPAGLAFEPFVAPALYTVRGHKPYPKNGTTWPANEFKDQVKDARDATGTGAGNRNKAKGQALYSSTSLKPALYGGPTDNIGDKLRGGHYQDPALVPACTVPPIAAPSPSKPTVTLRGLSDPTAAKWEPAAGADVRCWAVWFHVGDKWGPMQVYSRNETRQEVDSNVNGVAVKLIDKHNRQSDFVIVSAP